MPRSANSLFASGAISGKQMGKLAVLKKTRVQKSKMAPFEQKTRDEGDPRNVGEKNYSVDHINEREVQKLGTAGRVSKGGGARGGVEPHSEHINGPMTKGAWPKGGGVSASNPKTGNTRMKGRVPAQGGQYGGGGRGTQ
jgi:hypothetical protein